MILPSIGAWQGAAVAGLVALAVAGVLRLLGRPALSTAAAGLGLAAGWFVVLGALTASPRQLPERLPALAVAAALLGLLLAAADRARWAWAAAVVATVAGAWWLSGAPMVRPDLLRVATTLLALGLLSVLILMALDGPWQGSVAAAVTFAGLALAAPLGPWLPLAAALLAGIVGGALTGGNWPAGARLAPALGLAALSAGPVLARGAAADWIAAAAAPVALWLGPAFGARLGGAGGWVAGWALAIAAPLALLWMVRRG